ncbi:AAA family ATPase [Candidatus Saccharibacteria bacterium]|nr:AAA family ATPase [Candidatus Saccharibacteria bacterium]
MSTSAKLVTIGLAGTFASGKDSLGRFLEEKHNIKHISTSDIVRTYAQEKYGSIERPVLYKMANELRDTRGANILTKLALELYESYRESYPAGVCVSGFRAWAEAAEIKKHGGIIVFTDAPVKTRYIRTIKRVRDGESFNTFEEFQAREARENGEVNSEFSVAGIKPRADIVLDNDAPLEEFLAQAEKALGLSK